MKSIPKYNFNGLVVEMLLLIFYECNNNTIKAGFLRGEFDESTLALL